ncbi:universal stress protein UspA-like protein [Desulfosporosinus acidiphilus SJ4]|uniref:Universal stress protein n=1 Tax=Desulfosporosinus acidiphilus (strain DSM 22704 / JCM 16185 / SJ4) TaxID=646529 RepID=I4D480_DESAJ|nr:universal stress protein [Desulfosporosinus acidiphilus]AFM40604.1 universal stress protein UspA-like protein [Desulfosporosinus acidiphilus SJ4]
MYKKILVPTDASNYSRKALITALELARKFNAEIELLHVMYEPVVSSLGIADSYIAPFEQIERNGELVLKAALEGIDIGDVTFKKKKIHGNPGQIIIQEVEDENIDLVVMGSHGYGLVVGSILGSVSQKVLHGAKCSVLIAK